MKKILVNFIREQLIPNYLALIGIQKKLKILGISKIFDSNYFRVINNVKI